MLVYCIPPAVCAWGAQELAGAAGRDASNPAHVVGTVRPREPLLHGKVAVLQKPANFGMLLCCSCGMH